MWDTPFNRALNKVKGKPLHDPPEYGRVAGAGVGASWNYYYKEDKETRKQRRRLNTVTLDDVQKAVEAATWKAREEAREELKSTFSALVPAMHKWTKENPNADHFPIPSFIGSNSANTGFAPAHATGTNSSHPPQSLIAAPPAALACPTGF